MNNKLYKSIAEVSELLKIKQHVIRYWDSHIEGISTRLGKKKRRYFSPQNIDKLSSLKNLLHTKDKPHHSLKIARKILNNYNVKKNIILLKDKPYKDKEVDIGNLIKVSKNLKNLIKLI